MAKVDTKVLIEAIADKMPNLTEIQSQKVANFFNGQGLELLAEPELFKSVIGTTVGFWLELYREYNFKNPLEGAGVIRRGSNIGFNMQRIYNYESDNTFNDASSLKGPRNADGKPLVPMKKAWKFEQSFAPVNLGGLQIWTTIWDDMFYSTAVNDAGDRAMIMGAITRDLYKKWDKFVYGMESYLLSASGDLEKLKDTQKISVNLGNTDYLSITGDGAMDFVQSIDNLEYVGKTVGYKDFNEKSFMEYFAEDDSDRVLIVRPGLKSAIRKSLMKGNYFSPEYVQRMIDKLVELPTPLTPCSYKTKKDATELYPVYSNDDNGVALGLSKTAGQTGLDNVEYYFGDDKIEYTEKNPEVFAVLIDKNRINWIDGPGGSISVNSTVYDAFNHCYDLIAENFGVNSEGVKVGASVFIDRTYPYVAFVNSAE